MRFGVRSKAVDNLEDVKTGLITTRRIIFTPNVEVKDELKKEGAKVPVPFASFSPARAK